MSEMKMIVEDPKLKTIVTNITIDGLDQMKKESKEARDVTHWLDLVFCRCVGNVQTMQQGEQKSIQRLRRSDYTAWILQHLVNIGTKLQRQRKQVVLLVDSEDRQVSQNKRAPGLLCVLPFFREIGIRQECSLFVSVVTFAGARLRWQKCER